MDVGTEEYYRQLCETLGVALLATDEDRNIRVWNAAASRTFGAGESLMIGTPVVSILPRAVRREFELRLLQSIKYGTTNQLEFDHRDEQGARRELAATVAPVLSESGEHIGASVCFRDITKRIVLQKEVAESRKMVSLGELSGAVAHHFNNILGGVVTCIDFARAQQNPLTDRKVLEQIGDALGKATRLIDGLLAFSEGDLRTQELADLTETLSALIDEWEARLVDSDIRLNASLEILPVTPVQRKALKTTLNNIIQNAIEAMPEGGELRIAARRVLQGIEVTISDTGVGLDEATRERIFEPFWTTKGVLGRGEGESVGLGLAIAHGLAQMIGATIRVESRLGAGSRFIVTIPAEAPDADEGA